VKFAQWIKTVAVAGMLVLPTLATAQEPAPQTPTEPAAVLVRRAVEKEEHANPKDARFMFKLRNVTPKLTSVKQMIETNQGLVARLISVNDKPLTDDQRAKEEQRLNKLMNDPDEQARKQKQQAQDDARARKLLLAIPDAFLFEYDGTEPGKNGPLVRVKFKPNPDFHPPSRETQVFTGMMGTMWIDQRQERLVKIDGTLFQDVNFGWGALAHLDKGGRFVVEQSYLGDSRWDTTAMQLNFTGRAFFGLKAIKIQQNETMYDYHEVPPNLSIAQGIELLRKQPEELAERSGR
jgi:hypothetical protein